MKNRECNIICDILPLYVENVISDDTKQFVDEHLIHCAECKNEMELLKTDISLEKNYSEKDSSVEAIKKIGMDIKKKRVFTGILSACVSVIIVMLSFAYLTAPKYMPYTESLDFISVMNNNGYVTLSFTGEYEINQREQGVYDVSIYNTIWNEIFNVKKKQDIMVNLSGEIVNTIYYVSNGGQEDKVIYGRNPISNGGVITLPRLVLNYYFVMAIFVSLVLSMLIVIFRKKEKLKVILLRILFAFISYIISHVFIKGWNGTSYSAARDFYLILLLAIPIYYLIYILYKKKHSKFSN